MSAIDQAFIRAYQPDARPTADAAAPTAIVDRLPSAQLKRLDSPPSPHLNLPTSPDQAWSGLEPAPHFPQLERSRLAPAASPSQRRPLSEFARPAQTVEARFKPALEVDQFRWSPVCEKMVRQHAERLDPLVESLLAADDAGRSLIGIGAAMPGVGCTTLVACLARLLVEAGKTVAIVDGNFASPGLAVQLGLAVEAGWEEVLAGGLPLAEAVIHSVGDQLVLLPLVHGGAAAAEKLESIHASVTAGVLRYHYDIVLLDLGVLIDPAQGPVARRLARQCRLDGVVLLADAAAKSTLSPDRFIQTAPELAALCLGQVVTQRHAA